MNERIKELAKEAGSVADATYAKAPDAIWLREYNKKFAELIVRECADLLETSLPYNPQQKMIKKHFGVEE
jgi:hypothetical protein